MPRKSRAKWQRGRRLDARDALIQIAAGLHVYWGLKWTHNAWAKGWQIRMVAEAANRGTIFEATRIEDDENE